MRLRRPDFKYLNECPTLEEAKKVYRQKAIELHPDKPTGSLVAMQQLNAEWDYIVKANPQLPVAVGRGFTAKSAAYSNSNPNNVNNRSSNDIFSGFNAFKQTMEKEAAERRQRQRREEERVWEDLKDWAKHTAENMKKDRAANRTELDYEVAKVVIDGLLEEAVELNKMKGSIYYSFVNFIKHENYLTNRKQLEYIAIKLGYNSGWAYYKQEELKRQGLI